MPMQAAWYESNGAARDVLKVGSQPTPEPSAGQVRVKLYCSGVNPSDVKSRAARPLGGPMVIPHSDGAGVIDAVGEGVDTSRIGQRVWTWNGQWQRPWGTAAQFICLNAFQAVQMPDALSFHAGACLGIPGLTALRAVHLAGDVAGKTVLVTGASSAVGHYVTQMLKRRGAVVIGTVGSEAKAVHAKAAGADYCLFYKTEDVVSQVKLLTDGKGADAVIDMDFSTTIQWMAQGILRPHGHLVCYGSNPPADITVSFRPLLFNSYTLSFFLVYELTHEQRMACLNELNTMLEQNALTHAIGAAFSLEHVIQAHETVEAGKTIGNVVIDITH